MDSIPQAVIDKLPFSAEPMSEWENDTDIRAFIMALYPTSSSFASEMFADEEKDMREYARSFTKNLMESRNVSLYLDFYQDVRFGQITKYTIALKCCIQSLLQDAGFYSLAHVLESVSDIDCSLLLASNFYYKQAAQILRNLWKKCSSLSIFVILPRTLTPGKLIAIALQICAAVMDLSNECSRKISFLTH